VSNFSLKRNGWKNLRKNKPIFRSASQDEKILENSSTRRIFSSSSEKMKMLVIFHSREMDGKI